MMPRKIELQPCLCGCGELTNGQWAPGHDRKMEAAIVNEFGGVAGLLAFVEAHLGKKIRVNDDNAGPTPGNGHQGGQRWNS